MDDHLPAGKTEETGVSSSSPQLSGMDRHVEIPIGLFNLEGAATYLNVMPRTVRKWASEGRIGHRRLGSRLMFAKSDLDTFVDASYRPPRPDTVAALVAGIKVAPKDSVTRSGSPPTRSPSRRRAS